MKYQIKLLLSISLCALLFSCSTHTNTDFFLKIEIEKTDVSHAALYGFLGDNQIFVDSLIVSNNTISYPISTNCNPGVYRVVFENSESFDFIYNYEHCIFRVNPLCIQESFHIIQSKENKILYDFFNNLHALQNEYANDTLHNNIHASDIIQKYVAMFSSFLQNKNSQTFAYSIVKMLFILDYSQFITLHPESTLTENEFLTQKYFQNIDFSDERILATPYLYLVLHNYIETLYTYNKELLLDGFSLIHLHTSSNQDIAFFTHNFIYEYVMQLQDSELLYAYLENTYISPYFFTNAIANNAKNKQFVGYGTIVDTIPSVSFHDAEYTLMLFSDTLASTHMNMQQYITTHERGLKNNNIQVHIITPQSTDEFDSLLNTFSLYIAPSIIVVDSDGMIRIRGYGEKHCVAIIELLRK